MNIHNLAKQPDSIYYSPGFILVVESHLNYLRQPENVTYISVTEHESYKHEGDFYGLLAAKDVPYEYHHAALRMNGLTTSTEYQGIPGTYKVPQSSAISLLKNIYETTS